MKYVKFISIACILLWMGFIYALSSQPGPVSNNLSKKVSKGIVGAIDKNMESQTSGKALRKKYRLWNSKSRNFAHVSIFFVLSILVVISLAVWKVSLVKTYVVSFLICTTYAAFDELHQKFVPGRAVQWSDFGLDIVGIAMGLVTAFIVSRLFLRFQKHRYHT